MRSKRERGEISNALLGVIGGVAMLAALGALVYLIAFLGDDGDDPPGGDLYASMGDSVAAGSGASDAGASFPALVAAREKVELYNVAKAGATTQDVLGQQLADVLPVLGSGRVRFITISAGGNDFAGLIPNASCVEDPPPQSCPLDETLAGVEQRIDEILSLLREADARVPIVLLGYPNFFAGTNHAWDAPAGRVLPRLSEALRAVAATYERVAVASPSFDQQSADMPLTHVLDQPFDPHPNDAGHQLIANAMLEALDDLR
jgi:lysophospholipase L1-like esterase